LEQAWAGTRRSPYLPAEWGHAPPDEMLARDGKI